MQWGSEAGQSLASSHRMRMSRLDREPWGGSSGHQTFNKHPCFEESSFAYEKDPEIVSDPDLAGQNGIPGFLRRDSCVSSSKRADENQRHLNFSAPEESSLTCCRKSTQAWDVSSQVTVKTKVVAQTFSLHPLSNFFF